jgi:hypothetical protein
MGGQPSIKIVLAGGINVTELLEAEYKGKVIKNTTPGQKSCRNFITLVFPF